MNLHRLAAIVRADFLIRVRRPSTVIMFLLLSAIPYAWIPDPATGRALIQVGGQRALYNSAAIGMATAVLGSLFIGLAGFYVVSNALRRDVLSRCGYVIASTTMRGSEYIAGKFAGNVVFLSAFMTGFMIASMIMLLVRGEAPLEPLVFAKQYLLLVPPSIAFVSAAAILFECTPLLRTKLGDVAYFFLFLILMSSVAMVEKNVGAQWAPYFDVSGLGFLLAQIKSQFHTGELSIGASTFDAAKGVAVFTGFDLSLRSLLPRLGSTLWPLSLLALARLFFHRFDPARVRAVPNEKTQRSWIGRLNRMAKPLARLAVAAGQALIAFSGRTSLIRSAMTDTLTTIAAFPLVSVAIAGFAVAALASDAKSLLSGVMPVAFAACAIAISDVASREKRAGTTALVYAVPHLRARFVIWKFASALLLALAFLAVPLARAIALRPASALPLLTGLAFTCAAATALGIISANPKTFIVGF
ncbi:MAG TPA: hypothetical protein VHL59_16100, partial [Thermoanaerobaculia bacterium]|nr:hypothetical protein [Thermoanaerobaculia bacterium]